MSTLAPARPRAGSAARSPRLGPARAALAPRAGPGVPDGVRRRVSRARSSVRLRPRVPRAAPGGGDDARSDAASAPANTTSTTISALDALLGTPDAPEPDDAPSSSTSSDPAPEVESPASVSRGELLGTVRGALTPPGKGKAAAADETGSRAIDAYDPSSDPLGLGPGWDVPWSWPTLVATMLAVESSFYFAGALAPAVVYSANRAPDEIPLDDQLAFARDMQAVFDDPTTFADIVLCAEVTQTVLALLIIFLVANSRAPLPPGWFRFSLNPSGVDPDENFAEEERRVANEANANEANGGPINRSTNGDAKSTLSEKRLALSARRRRAADWGGEAVRAAALVWLLVFAITALSYALGLRGDETGTASNGTIEKAFAAGPKGAASLVLTTVVLAPALEETVFRGFLLPTLTRWMNPNWALGASTLVFALAHQHNTGDTAQLLAVGAMAGVAYCRTRNLAASVAVHATFNLGVLVLFALWTHS